VLPSTLAALAVCPSRKLPCWWSTQDAKGSHRHREGGSPAAAPHRRSGRRFARGLRADAAAAQLTATAAQAQPAERESGRARSRHFSDQTTPRRDRAAALAQEIEQEQPGDRRQRSLTEIASEVAQASVSPRPTSRIPFNRRRLRSTQPDRWRQVAAALLAKRTSPLAVQEMLHSRCWARSNLGWLARWSSLGWLAGVRGRWPTDAHYTQSRHRPLSSCGPVCTASAHHGRSCSHRDCARHRLAPAQRTRPRAQAQMDALKAQTLACRLSGRPTRRACGSAEPRCPRTLPVPQHLSPARLQLDLRDDGPRTRAPGRVQVTASNPPSRRGRRQHPPARQRPRDLAVDLVRNLEHSQRFLAPHLTTRRRSRRSAA